MHLLFVCTGNICRSPMAERLTLAYAEAERAALGGVLTASSAGTHAVVGHPIEPAAGLVLQGFGGNGKDFRAHQLAVEDILVADLVFTMTRKHRASVLQLAPRMMARTFTLREAASLLHGLDTSHFAAQPDLASRATQFTAEMARLRAARIVQRDRMRDDITDPMGGTVDRFQKVGDAIATSLLPILEALTGTAVQVGAPAAPPAAATAPQPAVQ